ncbi:hypothetical protein ACYZTM_20820 [Pseudomonas sp. MDT2-39-1]
MPETQKLLSIKGRQLLIGDKAPSLCGALEALVNRSEVSAKV